MRTLPANFSTGLANHYMMVWLVKLTGSAATYYWLSNKRGNTATSDVVLTESSVEKSYDSSLLARLIDGGQVSPIGEINSSIDISMGGNVASSSDVDLILLNQDRFDETLATYNLENRAVSIYVGFIPNGASPTLEVTNMLCIWTGVFDSHEENFGQIVCHLVDSRDARHKAIPQTVINSEDYPRAPAESLGQVLPILYGDFTESSAQAIYFEVFNLAPAICTDKIYNKYCIAGHITHTANYALYYADSLKCPAFIGSFDGVDAFTDPTLDTDDSGLSTVLLAAGQLIGSVFQMLSFAGSGNNITDFYKAIDGDATTYATINNSGSEQLECCLSSTPEETLFPVGISPLVPFRMFFIVDEVVSGDSFDCGMVDKDSVETNYDVPAGSGLLGVTITPPVSISAMDELEQYRYYFRDDLTHAPAAEDVKVYTIGLQLSFVLGGNLAKPKDRITRMKR